MSLVFKDFKDAVRAKFDDIIQTGLFVTDVTKDKLWDTYLNSFPEGTNPIFKERTEYDCQSCKSFIRCAGNVVSIVDNELVSIWDIDIGGAYQVVADAMSELVKSRSVYNIFLSSERKLGVDNSSVVIDNDIITWEHFYYKLPESFVKYDMGGILSESASNKGVLKRSLDEISLSSAEVVLELIEQGSLYRGDEHKRTVNTFVTLKKEYDKLEEKYRDNYCWVTSVKMSGASKIRNTVIGTLLSDISEGRTLDEAVSSFESKVAPTNYKRPSALITKGMIESAQRKVEELGIADSLPRRFAIAEDLTVNNVLFVDRSIKPSLGGDIFDELKAEVPLKISKLNKIEEVSADTFVNDILPKAETIELMFENKHSGNLMSLIAPVNPEAPNILKWDNNFSWTYKGEIADSMKQRVKAAGGKVDGVLRFSIQWNTEGDNNNDFDAHCTEPGGNHIFYGNTRNSATTGALDVDIQTPFSDKRTSKGVAVENITWSNISRMEEGVYRFFVENYHHRGGRSGFTAEIEYGGEVWYYNYNKELREKETVTVAEFKFSKSGGIKFIKSLPEINTTRTEWGIATQQLNKVAMVLYSPNHWDDKSVGNKHLFFILDGCKNDTTPRGFFNEYLSDELTENRKVFEVLGSKMKVEKSDNQLSGLGFSTTQRNEIICKVTGSFTRMIKIKF